VETFCAKLDHAFSLAAPGNLPRGTKNLLRKLTLDKTSDPKKNKQTNKKKKKKKKKMQNN
jgi:hypothetical protein